MCSLTHKVTPPHTRCWVEICSQQGVFRRPGQTPHADHMSPRIWFLCSVCGGAEARCCYKCQPACRCFASAPREPSGVKALVMGRIQITQRAPECCYSPDATRLWGCAAAGRFHGTSAAAAAHIIKCYGLLKLRHGCWCNDSHACYVVLRVSSSVHESLFNVHQVFMLFTWVFIISASLNFPLAHLVLLF